MTELERVELQFSKRYVICDRVFCCHCTVDQCVAFPTSSCITPNCLLPFLPITLPVDDSEFDCCVVRDVWFEIYFLPLERLKLVPGQ